MVLGAYSTGGLLGLAYAYSVAGRPEEAVRILDRLEARAYVAPVRLAIPYVGLGDFDRAFELLEHAYAERSTDLSEWPADPRFDAIRSDPRFVDLMERVGFPEWVLTVP